MQFLKLLGFLLPSILLAQSIGQQIAVQNSLYSLQQLRTVIPERLWTEEFALIVDKEAFESQANDVKESLLWDSTYPPNFGIGSAGYYFIYAAVTGETIRIDDQYLHFLHSPYWNAPEVIQRLHYLQNNYKKVVR